MSEAPSYFSTTRDRVLHRYLKDCPNISPDDLLDGKVEVVLHDEQELPLLFVSRKVVRACVCSRLNPNHLTREELEAMPLDKIKTVALILFQALEQMSIQPMHSHTNYNIARATLESAKIAIK